MGVDESEGVGGTVSSRPSLSSRSISPRSGEMIEYDLGKQKPSLFMVSKSGFDGAIRTSSYAARIGAPL